MKISQFINVTIMLFGIMLLASCSFLPTEEPPGVVEKAERGYAICAPTINALEQYKVENSTYPETGIVS